LNAVFVVDQNRKPQNPVHPAKARMLLDGQRAAVLRMFPFTIILKEVIADQPRTLRVSVDPGSRKTGIVLVEESSNRVVWAGEIEHRGMTIKKRMDARRTIRRSRRSRKTRHREPRFLNRTRPGSWLPPSLSSRVVNVETWIRRLSRWSPVGSISMELVKFDTQLMDNAEISGVEYQQGELQGYEVREYLLEKWSRNCVYCGVMGVPLQVEHITPRSRGGTNRVSNLAISCRDCNIEKGTMTAEEFGHPKIQEQAKRPLKDAAAVNATRWALFHRLKQTGLPLEVGTGGRTKFNRTRQGYPKAHWIDAACVGESGSKVRLDPSQTILAIGAKGWGSRQSCRMDRFGFPRTGPKGSRIIHGFRTGDLVKAMVLKGKFIGTHLGRVAIRATGSFTIDGVTTTSWKNCQIVQRVDGYSCSHSHSKENGNSSHD